MIRWVLLALFVLSSHVSLAQTSVTDGVLINADSMYRDLDKRTVRLEGNVQVVFQGQHMSCDRAELDLRTQVITAEGHVILSNERVHVEGDRVVFNYKQNTGRIFNGFVQSGQVVFEGDMVEKIDKDRYIATNANYTACETCPPGWSFSGRRIDAEIGGYARITRPVFKVGGVPIMILPGIIVPLKSARQSGFLVPSLDYSGKGGLALSESYFWAMSRSQDLTLTGKYYELRGYKAHGDYRYVASETSSGFLRGAWIRDRALQKEYNWDKAFDRWFAVYSHKMDLPDDYVHRMEVNRVSDLRYPRDFADEIKGHGDPALENKMSISRSTDDIYMSGEVDVYTNLLKTYPLAQNDDAVHRFPEIRYSIKERQIGEWGPYLGVETDYVNFSRDRYSYDDLKVSKKDADYLTPLLDNPPQGEIERDGKFDPTTDRWRTGQRFDIQPTLTYPFQIARRLDVLPAVRYRETQYRFNPTDSAEADGFSSTAARRYVETDLRARTEFYRVYGGSDAKANRWKHSAEPEIGYSTIPWTRRPNHPFFGDFKGQQYNRQFEPLSDADVISDNRKLQFDYEDRTYDKQVVDFAFTNRFTRKTWSGDKPDYLTQGLFRIGQSYDINEANSDTPHPWSSISSLLDLRFEHFETNTLAEYNPYAKVTNVSSRVLLRATPKNYVQFSYTQNFILTDEYRVASNGEARNLGVGGGFHSLYFEFAGSMNFNAVKNYEVQSWNYLVNIRPPGRCWLIRLEHTQVVGADATVRASFSFDFGGEATPSTESAPPEKKAEPVKTAAN